MYKMTTRDIIGMIIVIPLLILGFFGLIFGDALVRVLCGIGLLLVITIAYEITNNGPVYLK